MCVGSGDGAEEMSTGQRLSTLSKAVQKRWLLNHIMGDRSRLLSSSDSLTVSSGGKSIDHSNSEGSESAGIHVDAGRRLDYQPCEDDFMTAFLNKAEVKKALNVKSDIEWKMCSSKVRCVSVL